MDKVTLYGSPLSLYTGRARSYLIKAGIDYHESIPNTEHFRETVLPQLGGRQSIPTLELSDGTAIRDGAAIIDHFETQNGHGFSPEGAKQNLISLLFDVIGAEGLLRPAMHYRWNFPEQNADFIRFHFETFVPAGLDKKEMAAKNMDRMRAAGRNFGALSETFPLIESLYAEFLKLLDEHFTQHPYLLGNRPCIGDFGMIAPLYGHLGRDPAPLALMQKHSIRTCRWVERMNRPDADIGEFSNQEIVYIDNDEIPETLTQVLKHIAKDFMPETKAACETINTWLDEQKGLLAGTVVERTVGMCHFDVEGQTINAIAQPYRFYLLNRFQTAYENLINADKKSFDSILASCDMSDLVALRLTRNIDRENNREVWT